MLPLAFGWRHALFANWPVDGDLLAARLPEALDVQTFDGSGWLTVVPFANVRTRPRGLPGWTGIRLPEVNLRTYVTCDGEPGTYFCSLDADCALAVLGARLTHRLPYFRADVSLTATGDRVRFASHRRHPGARAADFVAEYGPDGDRFTAAAGSRAEFLTERRRLYTQDTDGSIRHTDVRHPRWPLYPAEATIAENGLFRANGFPDPEGDPECYYSPGVDVVTGRSKRWGGKANPRRSQRSNSWDDNT